MGIVEARALVTFALVAVAGGAFAAATNQWALAAVAVCYVAIALPAAHIRADAYRRERWARRRSRIEAERSQR